MSFFKKFLALLVVAVLTFFVIKTVRKDESPDAAQAPAGGGMAQAMPVETTTIQPEKVQIWKHFSGRLVAVDRAEIRPQVSGRITDIRFEDGQQVKKGDILIVIDPRPYQAALNQAKATLEAAKTQAVLAEKEYERAQVLIQTDAVSRRLLDERLNNKEVAAAAIQGAKAAVESAQVNLDYAYVKAPISGKVSRAEITEGNLVQAGPNAPLLTSIVAVDRIYADFEVDDQTYINSVRHTGLENASEVPVRLQLPGGGEYKGTVQSFDNRIDPASGTVRARAVFDNEDRVLLPGMAVSVLMGSNGDEDRILLTERAIGTDQDRKFVYVVNDKGQATYREVKIGESINGRRVILNGLEEGDVVITEGIVRIRPNTPVTPKSAQAETEDKAQALVPPEGEDSPASEPPAENEGAAE